LYWREEEEKGPGVGGGKDLIVGRLSLGKRPARMGIRNHIRRNAIPSKGSFLPEMIYDIAYNIMICNMCVQFENKIFVLYRLKINHMSEGRNMHLFLAQWIVGLQAVGIQ
jgi:hypothetical protein